jgi:hypothetical protein
VGSPERASALQARGLARASFGAAGTWARPSELRKRE